jgi:purine-nucleoside phosphorylase
MSASDEYRSSGSLRFPEEQNSIHTTSRHHPGHRLRRCADRWKIDFEIPFRQIPHLIPAHVLSHAGKVLFAKIEDTPVIIFSGRVHYYEGYEMTEVVLPVRLMQALGCHSMIITNAAGGVNIDYAAGDYRTPQGSYFLSSRKIHCAVPMKIAGDHGFRKSAKPMTRDGVTP